MKTENPLLRRNHDRGLTAVLNRFAAAAGLLAALAATPALADELSDVNKLVRAGQYAEALGRADAYLNKNPRDAQMRFLKGVILTEQNKPAEAIAVFGKLTEDHPNLPEPYNNLAVLYAASGQYEKARSALDAAIRTNPSYATAYENLGDIHAKLASQAYDKALQLDSGNSAAKAKLTLVRNLVGTAGAVEQKPAAAATPAPVPPVAQAPASEPAAKTPPQATAKPVPPLAKLEPKPEAKPEPKPEQKKESKPEPKPEPKKEAKPEPKKEAKPAPKTEHEQDEVLDTVRGWARAWSSQDMRSYLAYYGSDFDPPGSQSRKSWEDERRARIVGKGRIDVKVETPQVTIAGNTATVKFRQIYNSDRLSANTRKTLVMTRHGGKWQIRQESTGG
jgi:tetratricopeptide (TPR) repeat protein